MRHLHAPESNNFNTKFFEAEHVMDVCKIEHDFKDLWPLNSEYIRMVRSIYDFEPKSTCPLVPIMKPLHKKEDKRLVPSPVASLFRTQTS